MKQSTFDNLKTGDTVQDRNGWEMIVREAPVDCVIVVQELEVADDGSGDFTGMILHNITRHDLM